MSLQEIKTKRFSRLVSRIVPKPTTTLQTSSRFVERCLESFTTPITSDKGPAREDVAQVSKARFEAAMAALRAETLRLREGKNPRSLVMFEITSLPHDKKAKGKDRRIVRFSITQPLD